jgi:SAM-dependent methyltransferase
VTEPVLPQSPAALRAYYDGLLATHGDTAQGAGWPNAPDREMRFHVMQELSGGARMDSLCDVACGTGAFLTHLAGQGRVPARYLGVDVSDSAIAMARTAHGARPGCAFSVTDILTAPPAERFDYTVANGLFTVKAGLSEAQMWDFMTCAVTAMWAFTDRALAFNVMSAVVDWRRDDLFHVEADRLLGFLYGLAGRRVILRADYDLYEYTACVYRDPVGARGQEGADV